MANPTDNPEVRAKKLVADISVQSDTLDALMEDRDWDELYDQAEDLAKYAKTLIEVIAWLIERERDLDYKAAQDDVAESEDE